MLRTDGRTDGRTEVRTKCIPIIPSPFRPVDFVIGDMPQYMYINLTFTNIFDTIYIFI